MLSDIYFMLLSAGVLAYIGLFSKNAPANFFTFFLYN
jgi:hypothetical protein